MPGHERRDGPMQGTAASRRTPACAGDLGMISRTSQLAARGADRVTWTADERRVESVRSIYLGNCYRFEVNLTDGPALAPIP